MFRCASVELTCHCYPYGLAVLMHHYLHRSCPMSRYGTLGLFPNHNPITWKIIRSAWSGASQHGTPDASIIIGMEESSASRLSICQLASEGNSLSCFGVRQQMCWKKFITTYCSWKSGMFSKYKNFGGISLLKATSILCTDAPKESFSQFLVVGNIMFGLVLAQHGLEHSSMSLGFPILVLGFWADGRQMDVIGLSKSHELF